MLTFAEGFLAILLIEVILFLQSFEEATDFLILLRAVKSVFQ